MTPEKYEEFKSIVDSIAAGDEKEAIKAKIAAFEQSIMDAAKATAEAEKAVDEALKNPVEPKMTKEDRDRMALKLSKGLYPAEKVATVEALIADFDAKK